MKVSNYLFVAVCVFSISRNMSVAEDKISGDDVLESWTKTGTEWLIQVRQYSRSWGAGYSDPRMKEEAQKPRVEHEFHMRITVLEPRAGFDERVARIRFAPSEDAPDFMRGKFRILELDARTGKPKGIREADDDEKGSTSGVDAFGPERVLFTGAYRFPTDWVVNAADVAAIPTREDDRSFINKAGHSFIKKLRPTVTAEEKDQCVEIEAAMAWLEAEPSRKVVQIWVPGENWWRSFTRYIDGHIDLEATLVERKETKKE